MPPMYMSSWRLLIAGSILYGIARITGKQHPTWQELKSASIVGVLLLAISNGGMGIALQYIPSSIAALLVGMVPLFTIALNWLFFAQQRPSKLTVIGLLLGVLGVTLLVRPGSFQETSSQSWIGIAIIFLTNLAWSTGTLLSAQMKMPTQMISTAIQMLVGGVCQLIASQIFEPVELLSILEAPSVAIGAMLYLVLFGSLIAFSSYTWLARNAPAHIVSTHAFVNPVVAVILGFYFAGERFNLEAIWAAMVIIAGVVLITISKTKR